MQKSFGQTALSVNRVFRWGRLLYYCLLIFGEKICLCFSLFFVYGRFSNAGRFITDEFKEYLLRLRSTSRIGHPCFPVLSSLAIFCAKVADVFNLYISLYRINGYKICSERHPWCKKRYTNKRQCFCAVDPRLCGGRNCSAIYNVCPFLSCSF